MLAYISAWNRLKKGSSEFVIRSSCRTYWNDVIGKSTNFGKLLEIEPKSNQCERYIITKQSELIGLIV